MRELVLSGPPGSVEEYFRLDLVPEGAGSGGEDVPEFPLGLARWTRGPLAGGGWRTACDVLLHGERLRVHHTERLTAGLRELVFREVPQIGGRTVYLAWTPDGRAVSSETGVGETRRREFFMGRGALPLSLVELARRGECPEPALDVFQPLASELERCHGRLVEVGGGRLFELLSADGRSLGAYRFEGTRLVSFRWQAGGLQATAIPADEYERWRQAMPLDPPSLAARAPQRGGPRARRIAPRESGGRTGPFVLTSQ